MKPNDIRSWQDVLAILSGKPWRSVVRLNKGILPHPKTAGMKPSIGLPLGQTADYRLVLAEGAGLHVRDFGRHYEVHLDEVHPDVNFFEHLRRDAPVTFVAGGAAFGAAVGGALGKDSSSALIGGLIGGALAALAAAEK
jgi:hypothetical protein